jgi:octaprenyl-diphosphate synthase
VEQALRTATPASLPSGSTVLEDAAALVAPDLRRVENLLGELMMSAVGTIPLIGHQLLSSGGKRLRPLVTVLAARASFHPDEAAAVALACVGELIHTATLLHDDVVDQSDVRRGRPAARLVHGNGVAVLVGDFCLARSLEMVARAGGLPAVASLARTVTEMAEGEVAQLGHAGSPEMALDDYYAIVDRKTAALLAWCASVGGLLDPAQGAQLATYGRELGRAFQIADDVLDCAGDPRSTGKPRGQDLGEGKLTLPVLLALPARPALRARIAALLRRPPPLPKAEIHSILDEVRAAGGLALATASARSHARAAQSALDALPGSPYRDALAHLALAAAEREA